LTVLNDAEINLGMQISLSCADLIYFGYIPSGRIAGSYASFIFNFLRNLCTILHNNYTHLQSHQLYTSSSFSTYSSAFVPFSLFGYSYSNME
jgi:hypothetical protein